MWNLNLGPDDKESDYLWKGECLRCFSSFRLLENAVCLFKRAAPGSFAMSCFITKLGLFRLTN